MAVQTRRMALSASIPRFSPSLSYRVLIILIAWALGAAASLAYLGGILPISPRSPQAQEPLVGIPPDCRDGTCECGDGICTPQSGEDTTTCADCIGASVCGNQACEPGEDNTNCAVDCAPGSGGDTCNEDGICVSSWENVTCIDCQGWSTSCGDHVCNNGEGASTCPVDCMVCGNNTCEPLFGENSTTCPFDCGTTSTCGNGTCDAGENSSNCADDCWSDDGCVGGAPDGICSGEKPSLCQSDCGLVPNCGNDFCDQGETTSTCPNDCGLIKPFCGDNICGANETPSSCPADCSTTAPTNEPTEQPTRTSTYCGDNVCNGTEDAGWCPADCTPNPICGDAVCNGDETKTSCAADCSTPPVCGDDVCDANQGETRTTCSADCGVVTVSPTRTPSSTPTNLPDETDEPAREPEAELVEVAEVTTDEPPPTDAPPASNPDPLPPAAENSDLTEQELVFVETYSADFLPASCRLVHLDDADSAAAAGLDEFAADLLVFADRVLVCNGAPATICVPAAEGADTAADVQIISCNDAGTCKVYQSTELGKVAGETIACVESRFGRPMPKCDGACASGTGIKVTESDVSGYVIPFGIVMTVLMIGGVWFTFVFSRTKNREIVEEIEGMDDEGIVTKS